MSVTLPPQYPADVPAVLPVPSERVPVAFAGDGSGSAPLTWGQTEIWLNMTQAGWLCLGGTLPLQPGTTVDDIAEELRFMLSRFPSMRTRLRFDGGGLPSQVLSASGQTVLEIYDAEGGDGAREMAALVDAHYRTAPRDFENEWPVRMAVIRRDGVPTFMVVYSCHLVTDAVGAQIIARDMAARDTPAPPGTEQLDLARWQHSEAGRRRSEASLRYWEKTLQAAQPRPFHVSGHRREPPQWSAELSSPALRLAVRAIAARTGTGSASVVLALYAIALGRRGILDPAVIRIQTNNRFRHGMGSMVSNLVQGGICVIEATNGTVDQVVARAQRETMAAYKNAYYDPAGLAALLARDAARRGRDAVTWDDLCWAYLNDRGGNGHEADEKPVTADRLEREKVRSVFRRTRAKDNAFEPLYLFVGDSGDSSVLTLNVDTQWQSPVEMEGMLWDIEAIAVAAAFDPAVPCGA